MPQYKIPHRIHDGVEKKLCRKCEQWKELSAFAFCKGGRDGLNARCRKCERATESMYRQAHLEKVRQKGRASAKKHYYKHKEKVLARNRSRYQKRGKWCARHKTYLPHSLFDTPKSTLCSQCQTQRATELAEKSALRENRAEQTRLNKERKSLAHQRHLAIIAYRQTPQYKEEQRAKKRARERAQYQRAKQSHPERVRGKMSQYYAKYPHKRLEHKRRRRAAKRNQLYNNFSPADFQFILTSSNHQCLSCGKQNCELTADHIVPLGMGSDMPTNIQPLCRSCNARKSNRFIEDYRPDQIKLQIYTRTFPNLMAMIT